MALAMPVHKCACETAHRVELLLRAGMHNVDHRRLLSSVTFVRAHPEREDTFPSKRRACSEQQPLTHSVREMQAILGELNSLDSLSVSGMTPLHLAGTTFSIQRLAFIRQADYFCDSMVDVERSASSCGENSAFAASMLLYQRR